MPILNAAERKLFVDSHPDWNIAGEELIRTYTFPDFPAAIAFVVRVAPLAERAGHHPDLDVRYNRVRVALTTHDEGGLTSKDAALAAEIAETAFQIA